MNAKKRRKKIMIQHSLITVISIVVIVALLFVFGVFTKDEEEETTNGIYASNIILNTEERGISLQYNFNFDRAAIQREFDKITKLGIRVRINEEVFTEEYEIELVEGISTYDLTMKDQFSNYYNEELELDIYYIYLYENKSHKRYSEESLKFNMYELSKPFADDYAYEIISKVENTIVRVDLNYDLETKTMTVSENSGYKVTLVTEDYIKLNITIDITGDKLFSQYARLYFNGKLSSGYEVQNNKITYITKVLNVNIIDIELDEELYVIKNPDNDLYSLSFGNDYGAEKYRIIIELKDNNQLLPDTIVSLNGSIVEYKSLKPGFFYIEVSDNGVKNINIVLNIDNFEYSLDSELCDVVIDRDDDYDDILVTITPKEGQKLSRFVNIKINDIIYNLSNDNFQYEEGKIYCIIIDDHVARVDFDFNFFKYELSYESEEYKIKLRPLNYLVIEIDITSCYGYEFSHDVALFINGEKIDTQYYILEGDTITYSVDDPNWTPPF